MTIHELFEDEGRKILAELQENPSFRRQQLMTILGVDEGVAANIDFLASRSYAHDLIASAVRWVAILELLAQVDAAIPGIEADTRNPYAVASALGAPVTLGPSEHPVHVAAKFYHERFAFHRAEFQKAAEERDAADTDDHPFGGEAGS